MDFCTCIKSIVIFVCLVHLRVSKLIKVVCLFGIYLRVCVFMRSIHRPYVNEWSRTGWMPLKKNKLLSLAKTNSSNKIHRMGIFKSENQRKIPKENTNCSSTLITDTQKTPKRDSTQRKLWITQIQTQYRTNHIPFFRLFSQIYSYDLSFSTVSPCIFSQIYPFSICINHSSNHLHSYIDSHEKSLANIKTNFNAIGAR